MKLSISFFKSDYPLDVTLDKINELNYDGYIHVDICDGEYVDANKTHLDEYIYFLKESTKPLDIHLMVNNPLDYINRLIELKPSIISIQLNTFDDIEYISNLLHSNNIKLGLVINPDEEVYEVKNYLPYIDLVLIMSVFPGKGGQKFITNLPYQLEHLKEIRNNSNNKFLIHIDGGINKDTIKYVKDYVDMFVCGSYICCSDNYERQVNSLFEE